MKKCTKCKKEKELSEFYKNKRGKCGINPQCKLCSKEIKAKHIIKTKENYFNIKDNIKEKTCSFCKKIKSSNEFYIDKITKSGLKHQCKECCKTKDKKYTKKPQTKEYSKQYYQNNKEKIKLRSAYHQSKNKEKNKELKQGYRIKYREIRNFKDREKRKADPMFRLNDSMSKQIGVLRMKNGNSWNTCVGYTLKELQEHLEYKFTKNMNWENYGKYGWHIDHIIPKCKFIYDSINHPEFKKCWALSNLQPLWATTEIALLHGEDESYIGNLNKGKTIRC